MGASMAHENSNVGRQGMNIKRLIIFGSSAVVLAGVLVYALGIYPPPSGRDGRGAIGQRDVYRAEQSADASVNPGDAPVANADQMKHGQVVSLQNGMLYRLSSGQIFLVQSGEMVPLQNGLTYQLNSGEMAKFENNMFFNLTTGAMMNLTSNQMQSIQNGMYFQLQNGLVYQLNNGSLQQMNLTSNQLQTNQMQTDK